MFRIGTAIVVVTALLFAALIYVVNFGVWASRDLVDSAAFSESAVSALTEESSREAIANLVVDEIVEDRPVLALAATPMKGLVADALGNQAFESILVAVAGRLHASLFDGSADGITIELSAIRDRVVPVVAGLFPEVAEQLPEDVFEDVVIVEEGSVPELSPALTTVRRVLWLVLILAVGLGIALFFLIRDRANALLVVGSSVMLSGLITAFLVPGGRSLTVGSADNPDVEVIVSNLYNSLVNGLKLQSRLLLLVGVALVVAGYLMKRQTVKPETVPV